MSPWKLIINTVRNVPKQALGLVKGVARGLFRGVTAPITVYVVLLGNLYLFYAGLQKLKRARFAASVRLLEDLDESGVEYLLHHLPAWLQSTDYERAQFLNEANRIMWPAYDTALSSVIRYELLPILRENSPLCHHFSSRLCFEMDMDVRWAGVPDIVMKLTPSRKWRLRRLDMTPEMHIRLQTIQFSGLMRLALEPLLPDLPFIGGCSISFLSMPKLDFDIRVVGGADLMSVPALSSWIRSSVLQGFFDGLIWPRKMEIPFMDEEDEGQVAAPAGLLTVQILEAELPERASPKGRSKGPSSPYAAVVLTSHCKAAEWDVQAGVTERETETLAPAWGDTFHLCVAEPCQVLKVFLADDNCSGKGQEALPRGRVDVPLTSLVNASAPKKLMRMGSSAGIAMRARAAARRVRAQVAEAHDESSLKNNDQDEPTHSASSETRRREGSGAQANESSNPQHKAQQTSSTPHKSPPSKGFLDGSWIEAGDVLGAEPDSPDADAAQEGSMENQMQQGGIRTSESSTSKQAPASDWTLLSSSGSGERPGSASTKAAAGGGEDEQQQLPKQLPPIRTGAEQADDATTSPASSASHSPSSNSSRSSRAQQPRGVPMARARSQGLKVGLARLQSLPAKMARTTATQAALACQEEEGAWLPLLPLRPPGAPRTTRRPAAAAPASVPAKPASSSACSEMSDGSISSSEGTKYFPTLTKVNALFDHCADGLVGLFKTKPAAAAAASRAAAAVHPQAASPLKSASSAAASASDTNAAPSQRSVGIPGPETSSPLQPPLQSPFQQAACPELPGSSCFSTGQLPDKPQPEGAARSSSAEIRAPSASLQHTADGDIQDGNKAPASDEEAFCEPLTNSCSMPEPADADGAEEKGPNAGASPSSIRSGGSQATSTGPGRAKSGGVPPTVSNVSELLRRAGSGGSPTTQFTSFKDWHRATAGYSRPLGMRQTTARRSLFSFLFTAEGEAPPGTNAPQQASQVALSNPQSHRLARTSTQGGASTGQESTGPASSRPSVAGAVRIKLIFRAVERTCKPLSTLPNDPRPSKPQGPASGTKATEPDARKQDKVDRQRDGETAEQVIQGTPRVMGALVVLLQSITLGGMRLQTPAVVLRLGSQVRRSQECAAMHGGRTEWNLRATFALDLPADPCQVDHQLLVEIGEVPAKRKAAKWAPPASPTAAAWRHELHPTATCTIPLQSILDQGKAKGSWKMDFGQDEDAETTSASGAVALQFGWFPCT
ncbi:hypothetical protein WJX74_006435 [Apatococcus lobatus]|uniref:C2 domain-containing protein n=1 Tax=Apatococcus lobatus TaxID=904363 RepID=A0AAW1SBQ8_9CHLO